MAAETELNKDNDKALKSVSSCTSETNKAMDIPDDENSEADISLEDDLLASQPITRDDLNKCVAEAIQNTLGNMSQLTGFAQLLTTIGNTAMASTSSLDVFNKARFSTPSFSFPKYEKEDKLQGTKNYVAWRQRVELDLRTHRLSSYIVCELGDEDLPIEQKQQLDATVLRHSRTTSQIHCYGTKRRFMHSSILKYTTAVRSYKN